MHRGLGCRRWRLWPLEDENRKLKLQVIERAEALNLFGSKAVLLRTWWALAERGAVRVFRDSTNCTEC